MDLNYEKRGYLLNDFRLFHLNDFPRTKVGYHYHEFCKLLILRSGSGAYTIDGIRYQIHGGDIVLIDSLCVHRPEFEDGRAYERTIIYISPEFLRRQSSSDCDLTEIFSGKHGHVLHLDEETQEKIMLVLNQLEMVLDDKGYGRGIMSNANLLQLLVQIGKCVCRENNPRRNSITPENHRVLAILKYMNEHLTEELTVDMLADKFYISKYHMMRLFRKETGQSMHNYILEKRLFLARDLIKKGNSATDSCYRAGFHSYSSFTRAYVKMFGCTPTGRMDRSARREETFE